MRDCLKLTRLDILSLGFPWLIFILIYASVFNAFLIFVNVDFSTLCISSQIMAMMAIWSFFGFQERDKFVLLYSSLPVTIKQIVFGRYVSMIFIYVVFFIKDIALYISLILFKNWYFDLTAILQGFCLSFLVFSIISTIIPPFYKFGLMKGVAWFAIMFFIFIMGFGLLVGMDIIPRLFEFWSNNKVYFMVGSMLFGCMILYISYQAAIVAYRTRRWS